MLVAFKTPWDCNLLNDSYTGRLGLTGFCEYRTVQRPAGSTFLFSMSAFWWCKLIGNNNLIKTNGRFLERLLSGNTKPAIYGNEPPIYK